MVSWPLCFRKLVNLDRNCDTRPRGFSYIWLSGHHKRNTETRKCFASTRYLHCHRSLFHPKRSCTREQESRSPEPLILVILHQKRANLVFGKHYAAQVCHHGPSSFQVGGITYRCLQHRPLRPVFTNIAVNNIASIAATTTSCTNE